MSLPKITVTLCVCFFIFTTTAQSNSACTTPDNQQGECTPFKTCSVLFSLLDNLTNETISHLRRSRCGDGTNLKVCCPSKAPSFLPDNSTTSGISSPLLPKKYACGLFAENKIIRGQIAELGYYPWTVLLKYQKNNKFHFHCAGTLINDKYVLTAAHCLSEEYLPENTTLVSVRLGEHFLDADPDCELLFAGDSLTCSEPFVEVPIEEIVVHEGYSKQKSNLIVENDIALLRLNKKVTYNEFVSPVCLPMNAENSDRKFSEIGLWRAGWDISNTDVANTKKIINQVLGKTSEECNKMYNLTLTENQFCGIKSRSFRNCSSDSGATVTQHVEVGHQVVGVEAWHGPCSEEQISVYTRIDGYMKWIVEKLRV